MILTDYRPNGTSFNSHVDYFMLPGQTKHWVNTKLCSSANPILIRPLFPISLPVSTPYTIYHSRLTVCLPDSLDLTRCLSILFWISACE